MGGPFFICWFFTPADPYKGEALPDLKLLNFFGTHINEPVSADFRQSGLAVILAYGHTNIAFWNRIQRELIKFFTRFVCVKNFLKFDFSIFWVYHNDMEASKIGIFGVFVKFDRFVVYHDFGVGGAFVTR